MLIVHVFISCLSIIICVMSENMSSFWTTVNSVSHPGIHHHSEF